MIVVESQVRSRVTCFSFSIVALLLMAERSFYEIAIRCSYRIGPITGGEDSVVGIWILG